MKTKRRKKNSPQFFTKKPFPQPFFAFCVCLWPFSASLRAFSQRQHGESSVIEREREREREREGKRERERERGRETGKRRREEKRASPPWAQLSRAAFLFEKGGSHPGSSSLIRAHGAGIAAFASIGVFLGRVGVFFCLQRGRERGVGHSSTATRIFTQHQQQQLNSTQSKTLSRWSRPFSPISTTTSIPRDLAPAPRPPRFPRPRASLPLLPLQCRLPPLRLPFRLRRFLLPPPLLLPPLPPLLPPLLPSLPSSPPRSPRSLRRSTRRPTFSSPAASASSAPSSSSSCCA